MTLTATEQELGWVEFECPDHGFLVATAAKATVTCRCGKQARRVLNGRVVDQNRKPTQAKARCENASLHRCGDCGEDFGGKTILTRHRTGRGNNKTCLSASAMREKGWTLGDDGKWHTPYNKSAVGSPQSV